MAEIMSATNNFALDTMIGHVGSGTVYRGRLHDGREVAIKRFNKPPLRRYTEEDFRTEIDILSRLGHKHIVGLLGSCVTVSKDKRLRTTPQKRTKRLLTWWRKELPEEPEESEEPERLTVYEYMENGTLFDHMHPDHGSSTMSPVTGSWKMRIAVLLGVSRAIEHLHCHANPPIIHRDIKSTNILFDSNWVPHVSDFGSSVVWDLPDEEDWLEVPVVGTFGYLAPEYSYYGYLMPASDVYNLGVVILEVLTGRKAYCQPADEMKSDLVSITLPIIMAGNLEELLDRRPVPAPTPWQLQALKRVAQIARCCTAFAWKDRPAISDIVANLKMVHELICRDEPCSIDDSDLWPFLVKVDESQGSPCASSNASWGTGSPTHLVHYKLIELSIKSCSYVNEGGLTSIHFVVSCLIRSLRCWRRGVVDTEV